MKNITFTADESLIEAAREQARAGEVGESDGHAFAGAGGV